MQIRKVFPEGVTTDIFLVDDGRRENLNTQFLYKGATIGPTWNAGLEAL